MKRNGDTVYIACKPVDAIALAMDLKAKERDAPHPLYISEKLVGCEALWEDDMAAV